MMNIIDIIEKKKRGNQLNKEEIEYFIQGYTKGDISDYQTAALLMAIWFKGMNDDETAALTMAMAASGSQTDLSLIPGLKADKHSTGGVADTTTLIALPIAAACGVKTAKMSGRGLGHTGGTLDKLESIPGFSTSVPIRDFYRIVSETGLAVIGQTAELVPADKKLYALRDVTATVDSLPLIASSIMSKKIASGADCILLDVKTGSGAFMKTPDESKKLAEAMTSIGRKLGRKMRAIVTDMNQPLGEAIGNTIEVEEAVQILRGEKNGRLKDLSVLTAAHLIQLTGNAASIDEALKKAVEALSSGKALKSFAAMIKAQGGNPEITQNTALLPKAAHSFEFKSTEDGFLSEMDTELIGHASCVLGAGRLKKDDTVDLTAGIWMKKSLGDAVRKEETIAVFHYNDEDKFQQALKLFTSALITGKEKTQSPPLVYFEIN
jgi:pyrimidine-nucleoside phosphorylase